MGCDEMKVDERVLIETAAGFTSVTVTGFNGEEYVYVRFAEGDTAVVPRSIVHRNTQ